MRRIALSAAVGSVALLAVSIGLSQTTPQPIPAPTDAVQFVQPPGSSRPQPAVIGSGVVSSGETMVVKVYSVPDLVAEIQRKPASLPPGANPEVAAAMQQMQVYLQAAAQQTDAQAGIPVLDETTKKLERLKKAIRIAAPRKSWTEEGGEGEIEIYPEALCLIVRQTASSQEAIGDLLTQLRATQNTQIELTFEILSFDGVSNEAAAELAKLLNRELTADELEKIRNSGCKLAMSSTVRMANGQTGGAGLPLPLQITAVAAADRSFVEFRTELVLPIDEDEPGLSLALNHSRSVVPGKTIALLMGPSGEGVMLVTPKIIDRSAE